jgi:hypothetical protein
VWESDSLATVRGLVEETVGHVSKNEYFPVDGEHAIGPPGAKSAAGVRG